MQEKQQQHKQDSPAVIVAKTFAITSFVALVITLMLAFIGTSWADALMENLFIPVSFVMFFLSIVTLIIGFNTLSLVLILLQLLIWLVILGLAICLALMLQGG